MNANLLKGYRRGLTWFAVTFLIVHIVVLVSVTISGKKSFPRNTLAAKAYLYMFHLGPFFRDETIVSSTHLYVGLLTDSVWRQHDPVRQYVADYYRQPWRTDKLLVRDLVKQSARQVYQSKGRATDLRKLYHHAEYEFGPLKNYDSIRWTYVINWSVPQSDAFRPDTLFNLKFSPLDFENERRSF